MATNALSDGMSTLNTLQKDVFKQKGGTFGLLLIALLFVLLILNLPAILAWATNLLRLIAVVGVIALIVFVATDKKIRLIVSTYYMLMIRKIVGQIVKIDPVSICREKIRDMEKKISNIEDKMSKLNGVIIDLDVKIQNKKTDLSECLIRKKVAESKGIKDVVILEDRQSVRLADLCKDYVDLSKSTKTWYNVLNKMAEKASFTVADAKNEIDAKEEKYNIVKLSHSTFKSAMSIINGDPDDLALYNQAFNYINEDIMNKIGEMDRVLSQGGLLDKIDIENDVMSLKGADLMEKYEQLGIDAIFETMDTKASSKVMDIFSKTSNDTQPKNNTNSKYF